MDKDQAIRVRTIDRDGHRYLNQADVVKYVLNCVTEMGGPRKQQQAARTMQSLIAQEISDM